MFVSQEASRNSSCAYRKEVACAGWLQELGNLARVWDKDKPFGQRT